MLVEQVYTFGWSIVTGLILGLFFDFFRGLRSGKTKNFLVYIQDILFWIITAFIIIISAFLANEGELRGYMIIGYLLGAGFYMLLFSKYILKSLKFINAKIRSFFKKIIKEITNLINQPIKKLCMFINKKIKKGVFLEENKENIEL